MYIYICNVYIYIYIHIYICVYTLYICVHKPLWIDMDLSMYLFIHVCISAESPVFLSIDRDTKHFSPQREGVNFLRSVWGIY